jgi:hypothetical protein
MEEPNRSKLDEKNLLKVRNLALNIDLGLIMKYLLKRLKGRFSGLINSVD